MHKRRVRDDQRVAEGTLEQVTHVADARHPDYDVFFVQTPAGELGEPLASAIAGAAQLILSTLLAKDDLAPEMPPGVQRWASLQQSTNAVLREGVASIAQTLGVLLAKAPPPPFDTPRAALREVVRSGLVTRVAMGPFAVIAPLATSGTVPPQCELEPARDDKAARLRLPAALTDLFNEIHAKHHAQLLAGTMSSDFGTVTTRGCPVAGKGPITSPDGTITMSDRAGLTVLVEAFAQVVEKLLDAQHR